MHILKIESMIKVSKMVRIVFDLKLLERTHTETRLRLYGVGKDQQTNLILFSGGYDSSQRQSHRIGKDQQQNNLNESLV